MINRILPISIAFVLLLSGCKQDKLPQGFPEQNEFAELLAEVHWAEAAISEMRIRNSGSDTIANNYYHHVLAQHNLTQEKFDTIVGWYLAHPELYQEVYDQTIAILSEDQAQWQREVKKIEEEEARIRAEKAARNVWKGKKNYFISLKDTFDRRIPFEIYVDTISASEYRLSASYQFLKGSMVKHPKIEIITMYSDSALDTLSYKLAPTHVSKKAELNLGVDTGLQILKIHGYLLMHDTLEEIRARIKGIEFEYITEVDTLQDVTEYGKVELIKEASLELMK